MKRLLIALAAILTLSGCAARETEDRAAALQERYASAEGCTARFEAAVANGEETQRYTLEAERTAEGTRVTVREPEALAGISALVRSDGALSLEFDGMVLDAGSADADVSAVNALDIFLRAAAEGYVTERSAERLADGSEALRLCFETEHAGKKLLVTAYFDGEDRPIRAELERDGTILINLEFTNFGFGAILPMAQADASD